MITLDHESIGRLPNFEDAVCRLADAKMNAWKLCNRCGTIYCPGVCEQLAAQRKDMLLREKPPRAREWKEGCLGCLYSYLNYEQIEVRK